MTIFLSDRYGTLTDPSSGVLTGTAIPTNSVNVFEPKFVAHTFPLASMARPKASSNAASGPQPADGDRIAPVPALEPTAAYSLMEFPLVELPR